MDGVIQQHPDNRLVATGERKQAEKGRFSAVFPPVAISLINRIF
jgi:hypothetical protein